MKTLNFLRIGFFLLVIKSIILNVNGLKCFNCISCEGSSNTSKIAEQSIECPHLSKFCLTQTIFSNNYTKTINKSCAPRCPINTASSYSASFFDCCQTDDCNSLRIEKANIFPCNKGITTNKQLLNGSTASFLLFMLALSNITFF